MMNRPSTLPRLTWKRCCRLVMLLSLVLLLSDAAQAQSYNSCNGGWGTGIYYGTGSYTGNINSCTGGTQAISPTQYQQWDGVAGYNYKFTVSGGWVTGSVCWTYYEVVGGSWTVMQNGLGATADVTAQNTSPLNNGWNLIVFYYNTGCPAPWNWSGVNIPSYGSATLTYQCTTNQAPTITVPGTITQCVTAPTAVSYTTPAASNCNQGTYLYQGLASGSTFPVGTTPVVYKTNVPNGAGGYFSYPYGASNQAIALAACQTIYGGNCAVGGCGYFSYYYNSAIASNTCNCAITNGQYEWIFNNGTTGTNGGYTIVGQEYGGGSDNVTNNFCFARVKADATNSCNGISWRLAQPHLGSGGYTDQSTTANTFYVALNDPSVSTIAGTTTFCQFTTSTLSIPVPTGGIVTSVGGYRIHEFLSTGTLTEPTGFNGYVDALVVAGGGGGGANMGGGGGGGGVVISPVTLGAGSYTATVGAGGAGAPAGTGGHPSVAASPGGNSSFSTLTAIGGGRGGTSYNTFGIGINLGGSGGSGSSGGSGGFRCR